MFPQQAGQAKYMKKTQEPTRSPAGAHAKTVVKTTEPSRSPPRSHTLRGKTQGTHAIHPLGNIMLFDKVGGMAKGHGEQRSIIRRSLPKGRRAHIGCGDLPSENLKASKKWVPCYCSSWQTLGLERRIKSHLVFPTASSTKLAMKNLCASEALLLTPKNRMNFGDAPRTFPVPSRLEIALSSQQTHGKHGRASPVSDCHAGGSENGALSGGHF